jgi:hypothetical protein
VKTDKFHIDILTAHFVRNPDWFDVVVASNLFGDILSDLGPACTGTIGIAPSANINPERKFPSLFEPVHGSAPDIAGKGIANPIGQIWCGAMMLEHLGRADARPRSAHPRHGRRGKHDRRGQGDRGGAVTAHRPIGEFPVDWGFPGLNRRNRARCPAIRRPWKRKILLSKISYIKVSR